MCTGSMEAGVKVSWLLQGTFLGTFLNKFGQIKLGNHLQNYHSGSESTPSARPPAPPAKLCLSHNGARIPPPPPPRYTRCLPADSSIQQVTKTRVVRREERSLDSLKSGLQVAQVASHQNSCSNIAFVNLCWTFIYPFCPCSDPDWEEAFTLWPVSLLPPGQWNIQVVNIDANSKSQRLSIGQEGAWEGSNADRPVVQLDLEDRQLRQDPLPPHLHPLQRHLLDALFQGAHKTKWNLISLSYIQAAKMFTWENHGVSGNIEHWGEVLSLAAS